KLALPDAIIVVTAITRVVDLWIGCFQSLQTLDLAAIVRNHLREIFRVFLEIGPVVPRFGRSRIARVRRYLALAAFRKRRRNLCRVLGKLGDRLIDFRLIVRDLAFRHPAEHTVHVTSIFLHERSGRQNIRLRERYGNTCRQNGAGQQDTGSHRAPLMTWIGRPGRAATNSASWQTPQNDAYSSKPAQNSDCAPSRGVETGHRIYSATRAIGRRRSRLIRS